MADATTLAAEVLLTEVPTSHFRLPASALDPPASALVSVAN